MPSSMRGVIFDLDGTLVDLFDKHLKAFQKLVRRRFDLEFTRADLDAGYGMTADEILRLFLRKHRVDDSRVDYGRLVDERRKIGVTEVGEDVKLLPGARKLLLEFKRRGFRIALATSSTRGVAEAVVSATDTRGLFDAIVAKEDVVKGKPDPEVFLKAARGINVGPSECVVFEDSSYGVHAAKAAGMFVVGVASGHNTREELSSAGADVLVDDLTAFRFEDLKK